MDPRQRVRITHPFHPKTGQAFELADHQRVWGDDRVYLRDKGGEFILVPFRWTSLAAPDPVVVLGDGRARLRADDLLQLASVIDTLLPPVAVRTKRRR